MKTTKKLAYFCVAVLSDVFCLTSCTSEEVNPNYDAERGVVKTEFTISIPAKPAGTRMSEATVQGQTTTPVFRGIEGIKLYSFKSKVAGIAAGTALPSIIDLAGGTASTVGPSGTANNTIASSGALFKDNNAHLYQDIEVPIGTQAFMIYGVAMTSYVNPATPPTDPTEFATYANNLASNGTLTDNLGTASNLGAITFSPVPIRSDGTVGSNGTSIASYLTGIANATGWSGSDNVILRTLYNKFITMKAGSWASVKGAVQQLYTSICNRTDAVSVAIKGAILNSSYVTNASSESSSPTGTLEFAVLGNYPADIHLPDGAAYVIWNSSNSRFDAVNFPGYSAVVLENGTSLSGYYTKGDTYTVCDPTGTADGTTVYYKQNSDNTGLDIPNLSKFVYPAPLYYRALSDIRTANASKKSVYESQLTWGDVLSTGYGTSVAGTSDVVLASTRSIAIVDQVQYAVGRLDVTVKANATSLEDNRALLDDFAANKSFGYTRTVGSETQNCFPVTGLLISNQNSVDYQFHKKGSESYTIYDNVIPTGTCLTNATPTSATTIHTLVFETAEAASENDDNAIVKIAVEFQNNSGEWFAGKDGEIIYPDSKFYLVGKFDPKATSSISANPDNLSQVFKQDYVTTAKLEVASLKNAYNTMPDLRAPRLELGLSVDLNWNPGITQTVIIQ